MTNEKWYRSAKGRLEEAQKRIDKSEQAGDNHNLPNEKPLLTGFPGNPLFGRDRYLNRIISCVSYLNGDEYAQLKTDRGFDSPHCI